jgi:hypothetical protein
MLLIGENENGEEENKKIKERVMIERERVVILNE